MHEKRIPYKPRVWIFLLCTLFFGACTAWLGYMALNNDRGLILNNIFEMSISGATIFYWVLTALSGIFVLGGLWGIASGLLSKKELVLTDDTLSMPKSPMSGKIVKLQYSEILDLSYQSVQQEEFLNIMHSGGKLTISKNMLPSKKVFEDVMNFIASKVPAR